MPGFGRRVGGLVKQRYMLSAMCGRSTYTLTWEEILRLYRVTLGQPTRKKARQRKWAGHRAAVREL
jgi:hypothetical protein